MIDRNRRDLEVPDRVRDFNTGLETTREVLGALQRASVSTVHPTVEARQKRFIACMRCIERQESIARLYEASTVFYQKYDASFKSCIQDGQWYEVYMTKSQKDRIEAAFHERRKALQKGRKPPVPIRRPRADVIVQS